MQDQQTQMKRLLEKLFDISNNLPSFVNTEDSAKKDGKNKPSYNYTPGYKIVEAVKKELQKSHILLKTSVTRVESTPIEHTIYKMIDNEAVPFQKKELLATVTAEFTFVDLDSGETEGPLIHVCQASNGIDKSCVTAISTARRYFLIDFFNIITKDEADELNAHDSSFLPGVPPGDQPRNASDYQTAVSIQQHRAQSIPQQQCPQNTRYQYPQPPQSYAQQPAVQVVQNTYTQPQGGPVQMQGLIPDEKNPNIANAITELVNALRRNPEYKQKSSDYASTRAAQVNMLVECGINPYGTGFLMNLDEAALAQFEGRRPNFR